MIENVILKRKRVFNKKIFLKKKTHRKLNLSLKLCIGTTCEIGIKYYFLRLKNNNNIIS